MRYHPLTILYQIYQLVKNSIFAILLLFVLQKDSTNWLFEYGRYAFLIIVFLRLIYIVIAWFVQKYEWKDRAFYIYKGVFVRHTSTIPFPRIQNVTRKTTVFHKVFGFTSLTFETARDGEDDAIHFDVLSKKQANDLIELVQPGKQKDTVHTDEPQVEQQENLPANEQESEPRARTVHFKPKRKDLWKASFTSLSFLAIIPILFGVMDYIQPFLPEAEEVEGLFQLLLQTRGFIVIAVIMAIIIAVGFGIMVTFIRFGKYEISSDATNIFIDRGVLDESFFAIEKKKIQGLEIRQPFLKRVFGLAEVKLISSASPNAANSSVNVNSLYPFMPIKESYQLIETLLPQYNFEEELTRLPRKSLWVKLLRPSWVWIIATALLWYFKPEFLQVKQMWWILSIVLLVLVVVNRILDYIHTKYRVTADQVQWWRGGLTTRMFITKRKNIIEMSYSQTRLQHIFDVASVTTKNRSIPAHIESIDDIPLPFALAMKKWYLQRGEDIEISSDSQR